MEGAEALKAFSSLSAFTAHLRTVVASIPAAEHHGLESAAKLIEAEAKAEIGHYQEKAGPFGKWAELADRTKAERSALGFPPNNPLLRSGELLHSIKHSVQGRRAVVGSESPIAVYQEFGTIHAAHPIPPRSFLGRAAFVKGADAAKAVGHAVAMAVAGKPPGRG